MRASRCIAALLAALALLTAACALAADHDSSDVVAFRALIERLGLPLDASAPESWSSSEGGSHVKWDERSPRRIVGMTLEGVSADRLSLAPFGSLRAVEISSSDIGSLDLSGCSYLKTLICEDDGIAELDLAGCVRLSELRCAGNRLTELDLSDLRALGVLDCSGNELTELALQNSPHLRELDCRGNMLERVDLTLCPSMTHWSIDDDVDVMIGIDETVVRRAWGRACAAMEIDELPLSIEHDESPNAWVDMRNRVTVTTGLMRILAREEEIAGILLHEASHAKMRHVRQKMNSNLLTLVVAGAIGLAIDSDAGWIGAGIAAQLAMSGFTRKQEVAADDLATDVALDKGLDPTGMYNALERISITVGRLMPSGFNTHPPDGRRLGRIERRIHERAPEIEIEKLLGLPELPAGDDGTSQAPPPQVEDDAARERRERRERIDELMRSLDMTSTPAQSVND